MRGRVLVPACLVILVVLSSCGLMPEDRWTDERERIGCLVQRHIDLGNLNGCVLVAHDDEIVYERVHGIADPESGEPLTRQHRFRLASVSKQLTGVAVMMLEESGALGLDDPVLRYFPELPYDGITIRHVLTHTSGLPDYGALLDRYWDTAAGDERHRKVATNRDAYACLVKHHPPALFPPGERHEYCNTGYNLLALIIERVAGQTYPEFMRTRIFEPLGMNDTFVNSPDGSLPPTRRARGFREDLSDAGYTLLEGHYQNGMYGDGGVYTTIGDMFRYERGLATGQLLGPAAMLEICSPSRLNDGTPVDYGFGWSIIDDQRGTFLAHGGGWAGFGAFYLRDYRNGNAIIQLTNRPGIRRGELVFAIYEVLHGGHYDAPRGSIVRVMMRESRAAGVAGAIKTYRELKHTQPDEYDFSEGQLNALGYRLLQRDRIDDAVVVFRENVAAFPDSWNTYDSLGEAYFRGARYEEAERSYRESLRLNPDNENAEMMLRRILSAAGRGARAWHIIAVF